MEKEIDLSRRKFLIRGAGVMLGGAVIGGIGSSIVAPSKAHAALGYMPGPYAAIDIDYVKQRAWYHFHNSGG